MRSIFAKTTARIWGTRNAWSAAQTAGPNQPSCECSVELEMSGDERSGYNLVMSPSGFFSADSWHPTRHDALEAAFEIFGVDPKNWSDVRGVP